MLKLVWTCTHLATVEQEANVELDAPATLRSGWGFAATPDITELFGHQPRGTGATGSFCRVLFVYCSVGGAISVMPLCLQGIWQHCKTAGPLTVLIALMQWLRPTKCYQGSHI